MVHMLRESIEKADDEIQIQSTVGVVMISVIG